MLLTGVIGEPATQLLDPLTSTAPSVASVIDQASASVIPFDPVGRVDAHLSGLTTSKERSTSVISARPATTS